MLVFGNKKYTNNQIFNNESGVALIILIKRNLQYYGNDHDNKLRSLNDIDVIRNSGSHCSGEHDRRCKCWGAFSIIDIK